MPRGRSDVVCPHHPVNRQDEEQRRRRTSLSNTGLHTEAGFAVSRSALEVVLETLDDKDDLLWIPYALSMCHKPLDGCCQKRSQLHVVDAQLPQSFSVLLDDVAHSEDLLRNNTEIIQQSLAATAMEFRAGCVELIAGQ